ncbi:MAG: hypothetical protein ACREJO_13630 [Phycisphaerales bacterium]
MIWRRTLRAARPNAEDSVGAGHPAMTGVCVKCGYDLAGLAGGSPCPECGGEAA